MMLLHYFLEVICTRCASSVVNAAAVGILIPNMLLFMSKKEEVYYLVVHP